MQRLLACALARQLLWLPRPAADSTAIARELHIRNRCALPVTLHEAGGRRVAPGGSLVLGGGTSLSGDRLSLMYEGPYISENIAVLELNGMFARIGAPTPKRNINFIAQWGFIDLPLDVALWADSARTHLACRDGRARCTFAAQDCARMTDGSARFEARDGYGFCRSVHGSNLSDPHACIGAYAAYVNSRCEVFDRDSGRWQPQARSVGYRGHGWTSAAFSDGLVLPSTATGRAGDGPAVTYECWEAPCISRPQTCGAARQTSVGNCGFAVECDEPGGVLDVAVLEVTACPTATGQADGIVGTTSTTTGAADSVSAEGSFWPADGGEDRACRGADEADTSPAYYDLTSTASLEACKAQCRAQSSCRGIEYGPGGRCEVWTRPGGVGATTPARGYACLRYAPPPAAEPLRFWPVDGGTDRACRGASPADNSPAHYELAGAASLEACEAECRGRRACAGIEYGAHGRCELWTRPAGIKASEHAPGYSCFRYAATPTQGTCAFSDMLPFVPFYWDPACTKDLPGCHADGIHLECRFCGEWIFKGITCPT